ncbi:MAG: hypothetical protein MI824_15075 [Hyphomicrobiales bacterium]|nr:hypothetical protein [Hyphomicrobiales bacterium]
MAGRRQHHLKVAVGTGDTRRVVTLSEGRTIWALDEMLKAGSRGCTPIDNPAPRWSSYVHKLRARYGIHIETVLEAHGGRFKGTHARYILRDQVTVLERADGST